MSLELRQKIYDEWSKTPTTATVKDILEANGIDTKLLGKDYCHNLIRNLKEHGRPSRVRVSRKDSKLPVPGSDAQIQANETSCPEEADGPSPYAAPQPAGTPCQTGNRDRLRPQEKEAMPQQDPDEAGVWQRLAGTGKFLVGSRGLVFADSFVTELYLSWPAVSVREGVRQAGFDPQDIGQKRLERLEKYFRKLKALETDPDGTRSTHRSIPDKELPALQANPYVRKASARGIVLEDDFYRHAAVLRELPPDSVLDIFLFHHSLFTVNEKASIRNRLEEAEAQVPAPSDFGGTVYHACLLARRMAAMEELVKDGFGKLASLFPSLAHSEKKRICEWLESLPKDPGRVFCKTQMIRSIGITRSVYYLYVKDPEFGRGEIRKREQDEEDARVVRRVFEYRGFRKGARQIHMQMPRLTGKSFSVKKIRRLMKKYGMEAGIRKPNPARERAARRETAAVCPNLLRRRFRLYRPNQVRVTDVTYMDYGEQSRAYGSALMDPVTGRLVAFVVSDHNDLPLALETLRKADSHPCEDGGILHSDQGVLYKSPDFQKEVLSRGLRQSMSKKGNCWDNATQESFFGHFKDECDYASCTTLEELQKRVAEFADYYNNERGIWNKERMTPVEYETYLLSLDEEAFTKYLKIQQEEYQKMQKNARKLAIERARTLGV